MKPAKVSSYTGFGLAIQSTLLLPEFLTAEAGCDVFIQLERGNRGEQPTAPSFLNLNTSEATLDLKDLCRFIVRDGREVVISPYSGAAEDLIRAYLIGVVLALLLYQRGNLVLHASSVAMGGRAVAFMGASGVGKSSLAAALVMRGHKLLADDISAIDTRPDTPIVMPAFPQMKISLSVASLLGYDLTALFPLHTEETKRGCRVPLRFVSSPLPLHCVYVLSREAGEPIQQLSPAEIMLELIRHTYPTRLLRQGNSAHFHQCARFAQSVPFYRLGRAEKLSSLPRLAEKVERHT